MGRHNIWQKLKKSIPGNARGRDAAPLTQSPTRSSESAHNGEHHSTGTSGDSAEPCHSANEHLSNDQATPPDRGDPSVANLPSASRILASPLPVSSRAEVPPQAESGEQQAYTTCTSQRVWNSAYDSLKNDGNTATLVESYVRTLNKVLGAGNDADNGVAAGLDDPDTRQCVMKKFVEAGQAKIATSSSLTKGVGHVAEFIQKIKPIVDTAIANTSHAALPWAGVCFGLQILLNPAKATNSNLAGITHVVSRMEWYCALAVHLLEDDSVKTRDGTHKAVLRQLEEKVLALYKALLLYQMKSVCCYYRHQGYVFLRALAYLDDWDADLKTVNDAEETLQADWDQYNKIRGNKTLSHVLDRAQEMQSLLGDIQQTLQDFVVQQKAIRRDDLEEACRRDLRVVDPHHDMERIERSKDELIDDAYKWILNMEEYTTFTNWHEDESEGSPCQLLWINGPAGTGKTMLMIGIVRELSHQSAVLAPSLSFFFCQGTNSALNNAVAVLRSLIWLLLIQQPYLCCHVLQRYRESGGNLFTDQNAFYALSEVFRAMLVDPNLSPVYLAVDALDECEQGMALLIEFISVSLTLSKKVKWIVSSRPTLKLKTSTTIGSMVELDAQTLGDPVNAYIKHKIALLEQREGYDAYVLAALEAEVRQRANNTFLWVALALKELDEEDKFLNPVHGAYALDIIRRMPSGLAELYRHMMSGIDDGVERDPQYCKSVLASAILAYRPLTLSELAVLAKLPPNMLPQIVVQKCGSFLTTKGDIVYLVHQSAKEYLQENFTSRLKPSGIAQGHADISSRSIEVMSSTLERNMYNLDWSSRPQEATADRLDRLAPIAYSCVFWVDHLAESGEIAGWNRLLLVDRVLLSFLKGKLLYWLECLSLLGAVSAGLRSIQKLINLAREHRINPGVTELLEDAERSIYSQRSIMDRAPLQTYGSILVFSPMASEIRKTQWEKRLPFIAMNASTRQCWDAHRQTLENHSGSVLAVAFSPGSKTLASASSDKTVQLWDLATGAHQRTLEGHSDWVRAVAFSPDGKMIASASYDKTVRLWDPVTGAHQRTLQGHRGSVNAVAFSPDGNMVASASGDKTVRVWDRVTGAHQRTLKGHSDWVMDVAFSPDGKTVASASDDKIVRLWSSVTGAHERILKGHSSSVKAVAFSPDGKSLASASSDKTVRLWELTTGAHKRTLDGHSGWVIAVAFSPDGKTLASASIDKTVRLWDLDTGAHQRSLEGHNHWVRGVAFSPDGKTLASASDDETVRLWDPATGIYQKMREAHSDSINALAFSPDGKTLASASNDETVRLWDSDTGGHWRILDGHGGCVNAVGFSPDGKMIASASDDKTVRLWDPVTGAHQRTLQGHKGSVNAVAFSPDSKMIASASDDKTVRVWDPTTGAHQRIFDGHSDWVMDVAFSPDGKTVASASDDVIVQLWDPLTGAHRRTLEIGKHWVIALAFSPDGKTLASASGETVRLWDPVTGTRQRMLQGCSGSMRAVALSPDGKTLASASADRTVRLWDLATGACRRTLESHSDWVRAVAFSPDGKMMASASDDKTVQLWDLTTGIHQWRREGHIALANDVAFSPDGKMLASASNDRTVRLWDPATGALQGTLEGHSNWVNDVAFSPDGKTLASASTDCTVQLWDLTTGTHQRTLEGHRGSVVDVSFSPDGKTLASASGDRTVRLWDLATGNHQWTVEGHKHWVTGVAFSPDGKTLASASYDGTLQLWNPATGAHQRTIKGHNGSITDDAFSLDRQYFTTDPDILRLSSTSASTGHHTARALFVDNEWILMNGKKCLWLPDEYRSSQVAVHGNKMVLGHLSGDLTFLEAK